MPDPKFSIGDKVYVYPLPSPIVITDRVWNSPGGRWIYTLKITEELSSVISEEALSLDPKKPNPRGTRPWMVKCPKSGRELFDKAYLDKI